jgi:hypothetical protein
MRRPNEQQSGFSTFELLISISLSAIILGPLVTLLHQLMISQLSLIKRSEESYQLLKLRGLLRGVLNDLDSHRFFFPPRVHPHGMITFSDGSPNPVMDGAAARRPYAESDAITSFKLDYTRVWRVLHSETEGDELKLLVCPLLESSGKDPPEFHSLLGLSLDGAIELTGEFSARRQCQEIVLHRGKSMVASQDPPREALRLLLPMVDEYTLYVDQTGIVRYLAHAGGRNIENQPLLTGVRSLALTLRLLESVRIYEVEAQISVVHAEALKRLLLRNKISRQESINLLFNFPL